VLRTIGELGVVATALGLFLVVLGLVNLFTLAVSGGWQDRHRGLRELMMNNPFAAALVLGGRLLRAGAMVAGGGLMVAAAFLALDAALN
jgi:hypothetical protein